MYDDMQEGIPPLPKITMASENVLEVKMTPDTVLSEAETLIYGAREADYGSPSDNLATIGQLWSAYLDNRPGYSGKQCEDCHNLTPVDVCYMMELLKMARGIPGAYYNKVKRDTVVDAAGYLGLIERAGGIG